MSEGMENNWQSHHSEIFPFAVGRKLGITMSKRWASFENTVRELASYIWDKECNPEHIGGVDIDGVIVQDDDVRVFVEITERDDLGKVREDINKLVTAKAALLQQTGAFARCFCVINGRTTPAMLEAGAPHKIKVVSLQKFSRYFYDFEMYRAAREKAAFGSAVNPITGRKDDSDYVPVKYMVEGASKELSTSDLAKLLKEGRRIILLGEYGSGKSRCHRELFRLLATDAAANYLYPLALDLREAWGLKRGQELLRRHLEDLGVQKLQDSAIRALNRNCLMLLLDGFDELGSQSWSKDSDKLRVIRAKSLEGVKDLVRKSTAGVLVSGREHYFNNNEEMLSALGFEASTTIIVRCKTEFSEEETQEFFKRIQSEVVIPTWLPRRPLICQTIADLSADELDEMFGVGENETEFWNHFVRVLCERDARIHVSFDAKTIERILMYLARVTRLRPANVGPISLTEVQSAFETVVGQAPVEEASVMLQRLPALGRVKSESNDRQFIDVYILDGLRAKDAAEAVRMDESSVRDLVSTAFQNPLEDLGQKLLASEIGERAQDYRNLAARCLNGSNRVLGCDIVSALLRTGRENFDFRGLTINEGHFIRLDMSKTLPLGLTISSTIFGEIVLPPSPPPRTSISGCIASRVYGVSSASALPAWITNLSSDSYDSVESVSRIRKIGLDPKHEVLTTIVRKTFFQKGTGRKEEALLRGLGRVATPALSDKILNFLLREGVLTRFRGDEGWVYAPNRALAGRMKKMLYELKVSTDPIWTKVADL